MSDDAVTVPRELLTLVLAAAVRAQEDRHFYGWGAGLPGVSAKAKMELARIAELRRAAGMEEDHG
jgi:hypothetical protein